MKNILTKKEIKQRYFDKKYNEAEFIDCACGCGQKLKSVDHYARPVEYINGHNGRKYKEKNQFKKEWTYRNREFLYQKKMERYRRLKSKIIKLKGNVCSKCGIEYNGNNAAIFQFHHTDPSTKSFCVPHMLVNKSWDDVLKELDKCELLCSNCHDSLHWCSYVLSRYMSQKLDAVKRMGSKCEACGLKCTNSNLSIFQFHHIDPSQKEHQISYMFDRQIRTDLDSELDKCELLCSNCHDLKHSCQF